jgi:hypothetical protein
MAPESFIVSYIYTLPPIVNETSSGVRADRRSP